MNVKDFNDLVLHFFSPLLEKHLEFFFAIAWSIWHNRNKIIHDEHGLPPNQIWDLAKSIVGEFNVASSWDFSIRQPSLLGWAAPPLGFAKVNVDGACSIDGSGIFGVGVIIRDELGSVIAALCKALPSHFSAEWIEYLALEQGILLAQELNLSHVIFESDASSVILAVSQGNVDGPMGHFVHSFWSASSSFSCCLFHHVKRDCNRAAHVLAQVAKCNIFSSLWKGVIPPLWLISFSQAFLSLC